MEQGILLVVISLIIVVVAGVILIVFSLVFLTTIGAAQFGSKCYFSFAEYHVIDDFLFPAQEIGNALFGLFGQHLNFVGQEQAAGVQSSCIQNSNVNGQSTSALGQQIYSKAASCFNLFQGATAGPGGEIISSLDNIFECYIGKIYTSGTSGLSKYADLITYIDQNYPNPAGTLQIVFLTNGSNGQAAYASPNQKIFNDSNYLIDYFNYNLSGNDKQNCSISFSAQCSYVSNADQPAVSGSGNDNCGNDNLPVANETVSSISTGNPFNEVSSNNKPEICGEPVDIIPFCGALLNVMVASQSRVFVCVTNATSP